MKQLSLWDAPKQITKAQVKLVRLQMVGMKPCEKCGKTIEFELQDLCDKCLHEENRQFRERQRRAHWTWLSTCLTLTVTTIWIPTNFTMFTTVLFRRMRDKSDV